MNGKVIGAFIAGVATGAGAAYVYFSKKMDEVIEADRKDQRDLYKRKYKEAIKDDGWEDPDEEHVPINKKKKGKRPASQEEGAKKKGTDYTKFSKKEKTKVEKPEVKAEEEDSEDEYIKKGEILAGIKRITEEEFIKNTQGDQEFYIEELTFYVDTAELKDAYDNTIDYIDAADMLGNEIYEELQDYDEAVIYVRNYNNYIDYKIIRRCEGEPED